MKLIPNTDKYRDGRQREIRRREKEREREISLKNIDENFPNKVFISQIQ